MDFDSVVGGANIFVQRSAAAGIIFFEIFAQGRVIHQFAGLSFGVEVLGHQCDIKPFVVTDFLHSKFGKIKVDNAVIYENNNEEPRIELYKTRMVNRKHELWRMDELSCGCNDRYEVYIPKGSVKQMYNLDLQ